MPKKEKKVPIVVCIYVRRIFFGKPEGGEIVLSRTLKEKRYTISHSINVLSLNFYLSMYPSTA